MWETDFYLSLSKRGGALSFITDFMPPGEGVQRPLGTTPLVLDVLLNRLCIGASTERPVLSLVIR